MRASLRLGWRALWGRKHRLLMLALLVAVGIAGLAAVRSTVTDLTRQMTVDARALLGADVEVRLPADLSEAQQAAVEAVEQAGGASQTVTRLSTVAAADSGEALVEVRAIDPARYPWYGTLALEPPASISGTVSGDRVAVAAELADRLGLTTGRELHLLGRTYSVAAVVRRDPTAASGNPFAGPSVLIDQAAFPASVVGAEQRLLVRLPAGVEGERGRLGLEEAFGPGLVIGHDEAAAEIQDGLALTSLGLSLVALIALFLGGLGVAAGVRAFLAEETEEIAVWRVLGLSTREVAAYYSVQILGAGLVGSLIGMLGGVAARWLVAAILTDQLPTALPAIPTSFEPLMVAAICGPVVALLASLPDLVGLGAISPHFALRSDQTARALTGPKVAAAAVVGATGLALVVFLARSVGAGAAFLAVLAVATLALLLISNLTVRLLARLPGSWLPWRVARRSLRRPSAPVALVALSVGTFLLSGLGLLRDELVAELQQGGGSTLLPNLYLLQVPANQRQPLQQYLNANKGVVWTLPSFATANGQLATAGGQTRPVMIVEENQLLRTAVVAGNGLTPSNSDSPLLLLREAEANSLAVRPGDSLTLQINGDEQAFTVAGLFTPESGKGLQIRLDAPVVVPSGTLRRGAGSYILPLRVEPAVAGALQNELLSRFPGLLPVSLADVLSLAEETVNQAVLLLRGISLLALAAGAVAVASAIVSTQLERRRDVALFRVLGVTNRQALALQALESLVQGAAAGLAGGLLALNSFGALVRLLTGGGLPSHLIWQTLLVWPAVTATLALLAGRLALRGVERAPVLESLRAQ